MELVLITGMSGSGKSVALHALEDAGFYCVDNLPPELLLDFVALEKKHHASRVAIAMDVRSAASLPLVPKQLEQLRKDGISIKSLFLDASTNTLVRRYSETRRKHPLSQKGAGQVSTDERRALVDLDAGEPRPLADLIHQVANLPRVVGDLLDVVVLRPLAQHIFDQTLVRACPLGGRHVALRHPFPHVGVLG